MLPRRSLAHVPAPPAPAEEHWMRRSAAPRPAYHRGRLQRPPASVDATLVSPLFRDGRPHPGTETLPGASEGKPTPTVAGRAPWSCSGRWDAETASFPLARARASATPAALRPSAQAAGVLRFFFPRNRPAISVWGLAYRYRIGRP